MRTDLGPLQSGLFFHSLVSSAERPTSRGYDIEQICIALREPLDIDTFKKAWTSTATRHPILSTSFRMMDDRPVQETYGTVDISLEVKDWSDLTEQEHSRQRDVLIEQDRARGFNLEKAPLARVTLLSRHDGGMDLLWTVHQIIMDGRSISIVLRDLFRAYEAHIQEKKADLGPPPPPYPDFIKWLSQRDKKKSLSYYRKLLSGKETPTPLPCADPVSRPLSQSGCGECFRDVPPQTAADMRNLAQRTHTTIATVLNGAWSIVLGRYTGDRDTVFGSTRACRHSALRGEANHMVGLFINTLPLRVQLVGEKTATDILKDLRQQSIGLRAHEHLPLTDIQSVSDLPRGANLFETLVMYENQTLGEELRSTGIPRLSDCSVRIYEQPSVPLCVLMHGGEVFRLGMLYDRLRFREEVIQRLLDSLLLTIESICSNPDQSIHTIDILPPIWKQRILYEWNETQHPFDETICIHELFEAMASRHPDAVAVEKEGNTLSYGVLEARANQLAHALRRRGSGPDKFVGVCLSRGFDLFVALLGVTKSGAAYLPLDPQYPHDRLSFMLEDAKALLVVTERRYETLFDGPKLVLDGEDSSLLKDLPTTRTPRNTGPPNPCYTIFTSGSTGQPKGVVLTHRAVVNTLEWVNRTFGVQPGDRLLFVTSPCFDLSVYDIFGGLGAGATIVIASEERLKNPERLSAMIANQKITIWNSAPAALQRLVPFFPTTADNEALRLVLLSGDWIPVSLPNSVRAVFNNARVISLGGATEAAIWSNWYPIEEVDPAWPSIPYGRPIQNARYHVLDEHLQVLPIEVPGDLYIGGTCLASGYLNRPELTSERFIDDPFRPGEKLYKTGDLSRYFSDGCLEFLGRADFQVKIRGYRVEMGEVESAIASLTGVKDAVCSAFPDISGQMSLVAYVVREAGSNIDAQTVKTVLVTRLPEYMVPSHFVFLRELPLSVNGKVDRKALPDPAEQSPRQSYLPPRNGLEQDIVEVWQEIFNRRSIGIRDNFFDLGGHSLIAVMLVSRLRRVLGQDVPLSTILEQPTIEGFVENLDRGSFFGSPYKHLVIMNQHGSRPPLFLLTGAGGYAFIFHRFCGLLDVDQPTFLLNGVGSRIDGKALYSSVEEMAAIYDDEIRSVYRGGPIILGGYSFGALIAFELAHRLEERGERVEWLISFDGYGPTFPTLLPLYRRFFCHIRAIKDARPGERKLYFQKRMENIKKRGLKLIGKELPIENDVPDPLMAAHINRLGAAYWKAERSYNPQFKVNAPLLLFQCEEQGKMVGADMDVPLYGWGSYIDGPITSAVVPGDHSHLLSDENLNYVLETMIKQKVIQNDPRHA